MDIRSLALVWETTYQMLCFHTLHGMFSVHVCSAELEVHYQPATLAYFLVYLLINVYLSEDFCFVYKL